MKLYHRTPYGARILRYGFKQTRQTCDPGIWLSNLPLEINSGAKGMTVLCVNIPIAAIREFERFENFEDGHPYRAWLIPAEIVNRYGRPSVHDHDLTGMTSTSVQLWIRNLKRLTYDTSAKVSELRRELTFAKRLGLLEG